MAYLKLKPTIKNAKNGTCSFQRDIFNQLVGNVLLGLAVYDPITKYLYRVERDIVIYKCYQNHAAVKNNYYIIDYITFGKLHEEIK